MEIFDVVDENDVVVGSATREECHSNPNLIHRSVHFTLVDREDSKILLSQRSFEKRMDPGKFCFFGEHLVQGEAYPDAIKRGVSEELGFIPKDFQESSKNIFRLANTTELAKFFVVYWQGEDMTFDKKEIAGTEWVSLEDLTSSKRDYSEMTRFWIERLNWRQSF